MICLVIHEYSGKGYLPNLIIKRIIKKIHTA